MALVNNKRLSLESLQIIPFCVHMYQERVYSRGIENNLNYLDFTINLWMLEHNHGPPGVDQHDQDKHPERQSFLFACLPVTDTPVLDQSLEPILRIFCTSKVIHG